MVIFAYPIVKFRGCSDNLGTFKSETFGNKLFGISDVCVV